MIRLMLVIAAVAITSACASRSLQPGAEQVIRTDVARLSGCENLGIISAQLLSMRHDYEAHRALGFPPRVLLHAGHRKNLFDDARNQAVALGGNRVAPVGSFKDRVERWGMLPCILPAARLPAAASFRRLPSTPPTGRRLTFQHRAHQARRAKIRSADRAAAWALLLPLARVPPLRLL